MFIHMYIKYIIHFYQEILYFITLSYIFLNNFIYRNFIFFFNCNEHFSQKYLSYLIFAQETNITSEQ